MLQPNFLNLSTFGVKEYDLEDGARILYCKNFLDLPAAASLVRDDAPHSRDGIFPAKGLNTMVFANGSHGWQSLSDLIMFDVAKMSYSDFSTLKVGHRTEIAPFEQQSLWNIRIFWETLLECQFHWVRLTPTRNTDNVGWSNYSNLCKCCSKRAAVTVTRGGPLKFILRHKHWSEKGIEKKLLFLKPGDMVFMLHDSNANWQHVLQENKNASLFRANLYFGQIPNRDCPLCINDVLLGCLERAKSVGFPEYVGVRNLLKDGLTQEEKDTHKLQFPF